VSILLAAALLVQAQPGPTPDEARVAMALGECIAARGHEFADRPDADDVVAAAVVHGCADLERGVTAVALRMAGPERAAATAQWVHADVRRRALDMVRQVRTGAPPTGPGSEVQLWSHCITQHVIGRARGQGSPEEIVQAAEGDCTAEEATARAVITRRSGPSAADAEMARLRALGRERQLQRVARIRASQDAAAPSAPGSK
jgi:hypothetical protein